MSDLIKINKKTGGSLVEAAIESAKTDLGNEVIAEVKRLLFEKEKALDFAQRNKRAAAFLQKQIEAIEKGKFSLQSGWRGTRILFNDPDLSLSLQEAQEREWD